MAANSRAVIIIECNNDSSVMAAEIEPRILTKNIIERAYKETRAELMAQLVLIRCNDIVNLSDEDLKTEIVESFDCEWDK